VGRIRRDIREVMVTWLGVFALIGAALGVSALFVAGDALTTAEDASAVEVTLTEFTISPSTVSVAEGASLLVTNSGTVVHNLAIEGTDVRIDDLEPGTSERLNLGDLVAGTYTMFCEVAGHRVSGMVGTVEVGSAGAAAAHQHTPGMSMAANDASDELMAQRTKAFPAETEGLGAQPLEPTVLVDGTKRFDLTAEVVQWEVEPGKTVEAWTYNGVVPGPMVQVEVGDHVQLVLKNDLPESTTIHLHGVLLPNAMDGVPDITQPPVKPGETFTYDFVTREPMVGIYHSHHHAEHQVPDGLFAPFLVGEMPAPGGVAVSQEIPMVLNDAGAIGLTLNGKSFPATAPIVAARGEWVMIHYLNEGLQIHPMHLHGMPQLVVAKDGYPLANPYPADTIAVAPGERYTVLVHATEPGTWAFHCHILNHAESEQGMFGMVTAFVVQ
jgi:FtsP/CotA-like multicopper oxidase with cupredoxin domain